MRMVAGYSLIALGVFLLFAEVMALLEPAPAAWAGGALGARTAPWLEHLLWLVAAGALLAIGGWLARDWRRAHRRLG